MIAESRRNLLNKNMTPTSDTVKTIQTSLNLWLGSAGQSLLAVDGNPGQLTQMAFGRLVAAASRPASPTPWTYQIQGADLVVRDVIVTAFGGGSDSGDDGRTESGVMNDGSNPGLMGCALPVKNNEAATRPSPLAVAPQIPWGSAVRFWRGTDESEGVNTTLIDNGPDVAKYPTHAGDLTVAAAAKFAPGIPLRDLANTFEMTLSYRITDGARYVNHE